MWHIPLNSSNQPTLILGNIPNREHNPDVVVFVSDVVKTARMDNNDLFQGFVKECDERQVPIIAAGTKIDLLDAKYVPDCVSDNVVEEIKQRTKMPNGSSFPWIFTHNSNSENSTVLAPWTPEANGFEAATFNLLSKLSNVLAAREERLKEKQKSEL